MKPNNCCKEKISPVHQAETKKVLLALKRFPKRKKQTEHMEQSTQLKRSVQLQSHLMASDQHNW